MRHYRYTLISFVIILIVLACNLTIRVWEQDSTSTPTNTTETESATGIPELTQQTEGVRTENCLEGTWRIDDISPFVIASVPSDMASEYNLKYKGSSGNITVKFDENGQVEFNANQIDIAFTSQVAILSLPVNVNVDGGASGKYTSDGSNLRTENMDTSEFSASATAAGQEVLKREQILQSLPLVSPYYPSAQYTCGDNELRMTVDNYPGDVPAMVFERVQ